MKKFIAAVAVGVCVGSAAQAQTIVYDTDFLNGTAYTGTLYETAFTVSGNDSNLLISGSTTAASGVTGNIVVASFAGGAPIIDEDFAAGSVGTKTTPATYDFQFQNLSAGQYLLGYEFFAPGGAVVPVGFTASTQQVYTAPEIDSATAAAGLTLLVGGLLVLRGRRTMSAKFA